MPARTPVGVPGVDHVLNGGVFAGRSYMLVGSAGTGKTIFGLQWLLSGRDAGERTLYITLTEPTGDVSDNIRSFGWSLEGVEVLDLTPGANESEIADEYHIFPPSDVEQAPYWQQIYQKVNEYQPQRLVLDSLTQLRYVATDEFQFRKNVLQLVAHLHRKGCTAFLLYEPLEMFRDSSAALAVDGIFRLRMEVSKERIVGLRDFQVDKMRGSDFLYGMHPLVIGQAGIKVYPHIVEQTGPTQPGTSLLSSGLSPLDELLGGGLETGTTTLISGPAGVGKSTLCSVLARHNALSQGYRAAFYSFEESENSILTRCRGLGVPLEELLENGLFQFEHINAMELYPDQFLARVRRDVEERECRVVVVDSIRGYHLAMQEFGSPVSHIHNLCTYLNRRGVTTLLTNESEVITGGLRATDIGVSHLADNILLLRYAEVQSRIVKVLGCLKKRVGSFQPELREWITRPAHDGGIRVGPTLEGLRGILSGMPVAHEDFRSNGVTH